jgi:hypothetical protein
MIGRLIWAVAALAVVAVAGVVWVRSSSVDPRAWHVDPLAPARTGRPNDFLMLPSGLAGADASSPVLPGDLRTVARRVDGLIARDPRTRRIAGVVDEGFVTYEVRSRWVGWPDYVSVKVVPAGEGAHALAIWSRARFGYSDMGVNRDRVERWVAALAR